jgi:hypothetical protein
VRDEEAEEEARTVVAPVVEEVNHKGLERNQSLCTHERLVLAILSSEDELMDLTRSRDCTKRGMAGGGLLDLLHLDAIRASDASLLLLDDAPQHRVGDLVN